MFSIEILEKNLLARFKLLLEIFSNLKKKQVFWHDKFMAKNSGEILLDCVSGFLT